MLNGIEIVLSETLNATKIRIAPNGGAKNIRVDVFACSSFGMINETIVFQKGICFV